MNRKWSLVTGAAILALSGACEAPVLPTVHLDIEGGTGSGTNVTTGAGGDVISTAGSAGGTGGASSAVGSGGSGGGGGRSDGTGGTGSGSGGTAGSDAGVGGSVGVGVGVGGGVGVGVGVGGSAGVGVGGSAGGNGGAGGRAMDAGVDAGKDAGGVTEDPKLAVTVLDGWRYEYPCGYVDGHSLGDGTCSSGEVCWPTAAKARFSDKKTITVAGDAAKVYEVVLRIRGAIEPRDYPVACTRLPQSPVNTIGIAEQCDGFANQQQVTFNVWELKIADPPHAYYLNSVTLHPQHRVDSIDLQWTVQVRGRSNITFTIDDLNGGEIRNCSIVVPNVPPAPNRYDGNFFQLNVVSAKVLP